MFLFSDCKGLEVFSSMHDLELIYALHVRETLVVIILVIMTLALARSNRHKLMCTKRHQKQMILGFGWKMLESSPLIRHLVCRFLTMKTRVPDNTWRKKDRLSIDI
jgi:hypothetical protein